MWEVTQSDAFFGVEPIHSMLYFDPFYCGLGQCYWRLSMLEKGLLDYDLTGQPGGNGQINALSCSN